MIRVVRLGSPRGSKEGLRLGTVRRPPRGVPKTEFAKRDYYDVWVPELAPSEQLVKQALAASDDKAWRVFVKRYRAEMKRPEASRLLRPGGQLIFLGNGVLFMLTVPDTDAEGPATDRLIRDYFGMYRFEWPGDDSVEFHLGYGDWIRLLRGNSFEIEDLVELRPPEGATTRFPYVNSEWARRWPSEEVWKARKRG